LVAVTTLFYTVNLYCCTTVSHGVSFEWLTAWLTGLLVEARNDVRSAIHTYNSLAQTYQAANLRARSKSITPSLASFEPPKLDLPSWYVDLEKNS
jgi:hypothetical protein